MYSFIGTLFLLFVASEAQRKAFLTPQSSCKVKCLNGGYCAYYVDDPSRHTCLCLLDMFDGEFCEIKVANEAEKEAIPTASTTVASQNANYNSQNPVNYGGPVIDSPTQSDNHSLPVVDNDYEDDWYLDSDYPQGDDGAVSHTNNPNDFDKAYTVSSKETALQPEELSYSSNEKSISVVEDPSPYDVSFSAVTTAASHLYKSHNEAQLQSEASKNMEAAIPTVNHQWNTLTDYGRQLPAETESNQIGSEERTRELIPESEAEEDGWMMIKRRRIVQTNFSFSRTSHSKSIELVLCLILAVLFQRLTL